MGGGNGPLAFPTPHVAPPRPDVIATSDEYGPLPSNWERRKDHRGQIYYVDLNTRTTTWHRPSLNQVVNNGMAPQQQTPSSDPLGSLPAGWEERRTPEGRIYFVDRMSSLEPTSWHKRKCVLILLVAS